MLKITLPRLGVLIAMSALFTACGGSGGGGNNCSITSIAGEPELTGTPTYSANTVTAGDLVTISIPVNADTAHINLQMVSDPSQMIFVEPVVITAVTPADQVLQFVIDTTGYTPGSYFPEMDLCTDSNSCSGASTGIGISYSTSFINTTGRYIRRKFWDGAQIPTPAEVDACIPMPFITVN